MGKWRRAANVAADHKRQQMDCARSYMEAIKLYPTDHLDNIQYLGDVRRMLADAYQWHLRLKRYTRKAEAEERLEAQIISAGRQVFGPDSF